MPIVPTSMSWLRIRGQCQASFSIRRTWKPVRKAVCINLYPRMVALDTVLQCTHEHGD